MFEKFQEVSITEFWKNPLKCVSLPGCTWQSGLKYTVVNLQTLRDKDLILLLENNICGGISSVIGNRSVISDANRKIVYIDAIFCMAIQCLKSYLMIKVKYGMVIQILNKLEEISKNPGDSDIGYFIETDTKYSDVIKEKTKSFLFCPES